MGISSSKPRPVPLNDLVFELYRPRDKDPEMDIVFFHGLQEPVGTYKKAYMDAWMSQGNKLWPELWLGKDFRTARVLSLSFDLSALARRGDADIQRLMKRVIADLVNDKKVFPENNNRPVILVGHSFGGIFVKLLILRCHDEKSKVDVEKPYRDRLEQFLTNCKGIFLYSVPQFGLDVKEDTIRKKENDVSPSHSLEPNNGTDIYNQLRSSLRRLRTVVIQAERIYDEFIRAFNKGLERSLKSERLPLGTILDINEPQSPRRLPKAYEDISALLIQTLVIQAARLNDDFNKVRRKISSPEPLPLGMIFEELETDLGKGFKEFKAKIVPEKFDRKVLERMEDTHIVKANHFNVCKPESKEDKRYTALHDFIKKCNPSIVTKEEDTRNGDDRLNNV